MNIQRVGLIPLSLSAAALIAGTLALLMAIRIPRAVQASLEQSLVARGERLAQALAYAKDPSAASDALATVARSDPTVLGVWVGNCRSSDCRNIELTSISEPARAEANGLALAAMTSGVQVGEVDGIPALVVAAAPSAERVRAVAIAFDRRPIEDSAGSALRAIFSTALGLLFVSLLAVGLGTHFLLLRPIANMQAIARRFADADFSGRVDTRAVGELADLGQSLNHVTRSLRDALGRVRGVSGNVATAIDQVARAADASGIGATEIRNKLAESGASAEQLQATLATLTLHFDALNAGASNSRSALAGIADAKTAVATNAARIAAAVEETTRSLELTSAAVADLRATSDALRSVASDTMNPVRSLEAATELARRNVAESAALTERLAYEASNGVTAVRSALAGAASVQESVQGAATAMLSFSQHIREITSIANIMDEVADHGGLLAINASIAAAQAGEHRVSFAVVAQEIRDLSARATNSSAQIVSLVRSMEVEASETGQAIDRSVRQLEKGGARDQEAALAVLRVRAAAIDALEILKAVARSVEAQGFGAREVGHGVARILDTVVQLDKVTGQQGRSSEQIMRAAKQLDVIATTVRHDIEQQSDGTRRIAKSVEGMAEAAEALERSRDIQRHYTGHLVEALEAVRETADAQLRTVKSLAEGVEGMRSETTALREEVRRFRV